MEDHTRSTSQNMSRPAADSSQRESTDISQSFMLDLKGAIFNQKFRRPGELERVMSSVLGMSSAESLPTSSSINQLPPSSVEGIKRMQINLHKNSIRARDRAKAFTEASVKIEKRQRTLSEISSRTDISSGELPTVSLPGESIPKRYHQRNSAENFLEVASQKSAKKASNALLNRPIRNSLVQTEKTSIGIVKLTGRMDKNRDISISANSGHILSEEKVQIMQNGVESWGKLKMKKKRSVIKSETTSNRNFATRPDGNHGAKRGIQQTLVGDEKHRGNNQGFRPTSSDEDRVTSLTSNTRLNIPARGPRTKTGSLSKASGSISQTFGNADDSDPLPGINKVKSVSWTDNRKHSVSGQSSSPSVAQWTVQRPQKISRGARRSNLSHLIPIHDKAPASGGLSESKGSEVADNKSKSKEKFKKRKIEETALRTIQMATTMVLPLKKSKLAAEDVRDGFQSRGKNGEDLVPRPGVPAIFEKRENVITSTKERGAKVGNLKVESKPGRSTKKLSEPRGHTRLQHLVNNASTKLTGESIDDHDILLAAANAAMNTRRACSGTFWKQSEPFFHCLCSEDIAYLSEQIHSTDASTPCWHGCGDEQEFKGNTNINEHGKDTKLDPKMVHADPFIEQLVQEVRTQRGVSICQALLSAIIEEEDFSNVDNSNTDDLDFSDTSRSYLEGEEEIALDDLNLQSSIILHDSDRGFSNGFRVNAPWRCHDQMPLQNLNSNGVLLEASNLYTELQYNQMCIDDRILLELSEIGLYPDPMPDLAQSEAEDVREGINKLEEKLYEQVSKKKTILLKLEKAVLRARESEQKEFERIALDKLVGMAYEKYMACWGRRASDSKNLENHIKHAALSFVTQTLARCREFEERQISCFAEPTFMNIFLSKTCQCSDMSCDDINLDGAVAKHLTAAPYSQTNSTGYNRILTSNIGKRVYNREKCVDASQPVNDIPEQMLCEGQPRSSRVKRMEVLLDDVARASAWGDSSRFGNSLGGGTKRKRSVRDRELKTQSKDATPGNGTVNNGRPVSSNLNGKGRNKTKPKQKKTQLSTSVNNLTRKTSELPREGLNSTPKLNDAEAMDLSSMQLPETDVGDFGCNGQDIGSWLNINEDGMQDIDFVGLQIPPDDLSDIKMLI